MEKNLTQRDFQSLAEFRHQIRRFIRFSERAARKSGLEPRQHQLLLTVKGLPPNVRPRIAEVADRLQIHHHSAVELVNRLEVAGFIRRERGSEDRREVMLHLTSKGERVLRELSLDHREELRSQGPALLEILQQLVVDSRVSAARKHR